MTSYTAGIVYDSSMQHGSSRNYGAAYVEITQLPGGGGGDTRTLGGIQQTGYTESVVAPDGAKVQFTALPDTTLGFGFLGWYNYNTNQRVSTQSVYQRTISGGDITLLPVFVPNNPTFTRQTTVSIYGYEEESNLVVVRSMNGYYAYGLDGGTNGFNVEYEGGTQSRSIRHLPDGKPFEVLAKVKPGYDIAFRVNGTVVNPEIWEEDEQAYDGNQSRGATPDDPIDSSLQYMRITVQNYANQSTPITVTVTYTQTVQYATIRLSSNGNGTVRGRIYGSSTTWTSHQVPVGSSVTIEAIPNSGYNFIRWTDGTIQTQQNPHTFEVSSTADQNWTAQFNKSVSTVTITQAAEPTIGGSVWITLDGNAFSGNSITSQEAGAGTVVFHALAAKSYEFLYWYENSKPSIHYSQSDLPITFGDSDEKYIAVFQLVTSGYLNIKAYTSTNYNGVFTTKSGDPQVTFAAKYRTSNSSSLTTKEIGPTEQEMNVYIQSSGIGNYVSVDLRPDLGTVYPIVQSSGREYFRYTLTGYKYSQTYLSSPSGSQFQDCVLDNGTWRLNLTEQTQSQVHILTGVLEKELVHQLKVGSSTTGEPNGSNNIIVTGDGWYSSSESITVTATVKSGIDGHRYTFRGWAWSTDLSTIIDSHQSYTFSGLDADKTIVAVYYESCRLTFSAQPGDMGSVTASIDGSPVSSGDWVDFGSTVDLSVTTTHTVLYWTDGGSQTGSGEETISFEIRSTYTNWVVVLADTTNTLTVTTTPGGTVDVEMKAEGGEYEYAYAEDPDAGYEIPSGYSVRVTAHPSSSRYDFSGFTLYNTGGTVVDQTASPTFEIESMDNDYILSAVFTFKSWLSTLTTIMKVL